jgi:hypothetical protein
MIDRLFFIAFTFCLFAATALAVLASAFGADPSIRAAEAAPVRVVQLPYVLVVGKRSAPASTLARTDAAEAASQRTQRTQ